MLALRATPVLTAARRISSTDGTEVDLESYDTFTSVDMLADHMVASMLGGLSGRRYERALEPVGEAVEQAAWDLAVQRKPALRGRHRRAPSVVSR